MRKKSVLTLFLFFAVAASATGLQDSTEQNLLTTVILVRHAEKVLIGPLDAELTADGKARAADLAYLLRHVELKAIYSTPFKRTRFTARPTASAKDIEIKLYDPRSSKFLGQVLKDHAGESVLIVGHSNTIPAMANELTGQKLYSDLEDSIYDNLFIVSVTEMGKAVVTRIRFGKPTPERK